MRTIFFKGVVHILLNLLGDIEPGLFKKILNNHLQPNKITVVVELLVLIVLLVLLILVGQLLLLLEGLLLALPLLSPHMLDHLFDLQKGHIFGFVVAVVE